MKSFLVYLCLFALLGGVLCKRSRRQAPQGGPGSAEVGAPVPPPGGPGSAEVGAPVPPPEGPGSAEVGAPVPPPKPSTADKLNGVIAGLIAKENNNLALGKPVDPKNVEKILTLCMVISITGGEVSEANQKALEDLMTAAAQPPPAAA